MLQIDKNKEVIRNICKVAKTTDDLSQTKMLIVNYLYSTQSLYQEQAKNMKSTIQCFEQMVDNKSFYSLSRCRLIKDFLKAFRVFYSYLEGVSKLNINDIKRVDLNSRRQEIRVENSTNSFIEEMEKYCQEEKECNQKYTDYELQCAKLDASLAKFKSYEDPIAFYSLNMVSDFSKKLQKKFYICENFQAKLLSNLVYLDDKRKILSISLNEIKTQFFSLLHRHIQGIKNIADLFVDVSKDEMYQKIDANRASDVVESGRFSEEIKKIQVKYGEGHYQQELLSGLNDIFKNLNQNVYTGSEYKLFMDRCQAFRDKKFSSVEETLFLQKKLLKHLSEQSEFFIKIDKEFQNNKKQVFKSYGMVNFNKRIQKYFGTNITALSELLWKAVQNPRKRFVKMSNIFLANHDKLKNVLQAKEEEVKKFKKRIQAILDEHKSARKEIKNMQKMTNSKVTEFKQNVQKNFMHFKSIVEDFSKSQNELDLAYNQQIKKITDLTVQQTESCLLTNFLRKQKQKYGVAILKKMKIEEEIINIVKQDPRYEVLFSENLYPNLFDSFQTLIKKKPYEDLKKILQKKQSQERTLGGQTIGMCCGLTESRKILKQKKSLEQFKADLVLDQTNLKSGVIQMLQKGLTFEQSSFNPFAQCIQIMIPKKQILSYQKKNYLMREVVEVMTKMGPVTFLLEDSTLFYESLEKNFKKALPSRQSEQKQKISDCSSILKNNSSVEFKIPYNDSIIGDTKDRSSKISKKCDKVILQELAQRLKQKQMFSDNFKALKSSNTSQLRHDYRYEDQIIKFVVKESIEIKTMAYIFIDYEWKVKFPQTPMIKSFNYQQTVRLEILPNIVRMIVLQKRKDKETLFARKKFFSEVDKMNKTLSDYVVEFCERDIQVLIEGEKSQEEGSQFLELQSVDLDEQERKTDPRLSRNISGLRTPNGQLA